MLWNLYSVEASIRKVSAGFSIIFSIFGVTREEDRREEARREEDSWVRIGVRKSAAEEGRSQVSLCSTTISMSCSCCRLTLQSVAITNLQRVNY